jgi:prepilin-type N-terminal cleavage/methylation domain-containing protein
MKINAIERHSSERGFTLLELIISVTLSVIMLGVAAAVFSSALSSRTREASKTDAITSTQAALNVLVREIGNSGYGLTTNGLVLADCDNRKLHFRANLYNDDAETSAPGEDLTFFWDTTSGSVVRYDKASNITAGVVNRVSDVEFGYYDYTGGVQTGPNLTPTIDTGRVRIKLTVYLPDVTGQPTSQTETITSDVTLRSSPYMRSQY